MRIKFVELKKIPKFYWSSPSAAPPRKPWLVILGDRVKLDNLFYESYECFSSKSGLDKNFVSFSPNRAERWKKFTLNSKVSWKQRWISLIFDQVFETFFCSHDNLQFETLKHKNEILIHCPRYFYDISTPIQFTDFL